MEIDVQENCDEDFVAGPSTSCSTRQNRAIFEDDEVVREIDVFVSKKLQNLLYLLQYPLMPFDAKLPANEEITAQIKPNQKKLEIRRNLDVTSKNYEKMRGEQIALNCANVKTSDSSPIFKKTMDYQKLVNDNVGGLHTGCYAIGLFKNNELHLNAIKDIMQMKPSFFYLDAADEKSKKSDATLADQEHSSHEESDGDLAGSGPKVETVRVKFAPVGQESDWLKKRRAASYSHMQKTYEEEQWVPLVCKNSADEESIMFRNQLICDKAPNEKLAKFSHDSKHLMRLFVPEAEQADVKTPQLPNDAISLTQLRTLPLPDQVQALMTNSKVIQYNQLISLLPGKIDEQVVLKSLQNCAVLVQGCWVVKSEILYPRHTVSPKSGVSGEALCRARDFCLYKFSQSPSLDKKEMAGSIKIPADDLQDILKQIGRLKYQRGWQFLFATDTDFIKNHADIVHRQGGFWEAKYQALCHQLNLRQRIRSGQRFRSPTSGTLRKRSGSRTISQSNADGNFLSGEEEKVDGRNSSREKSAGNAVKNDPSTAAANKVSRVRIESDQDKSALMAEFRKFLYEKLSTKPCLTLSDIKRLLLLKLAESPPGSVLCTGVSDMVIDRCAQDLGAVKIFAGKMTEPVYAFAEVGSWPDARRVAVALLSQKLRVTFKIFKDACAKSLDDMPGESDLRQILHDIYAMAGSHPLSSGNVLNFDISIERWSKG